MSEDKLHQALGRAARAEHLLSDELLAEGFKKLEAEYIEAWKATGVRDDYARERYWQAVQIVGKVRDHLRTVVDGGKLAQRQLDDLAGRRSGVLRSVFP